MAAIFFCVGIFSVVSNPLAVSIGVLLHGKSSCFIIFSTVSITFHTLSVINVPQNSQGASTSLASLKNESNLSLSGITLPAASATYLYHVLGSIWIVSPANPSINKYLVV
jgi:hypothetical protein